MLPLAELPTPDSATGIGWLLLGLAAGLLSTTSSAISGGSQGARLGESLFSD